MNTRDALTAMLLSLILSPFVNACDDSLIDSMEVVAVKPSNLIEHEVELKGKFDDEKKEIFLVGPQFFSRAVGLQEKSAKNESTFFNWYRISPPTQRPKQIVSITDPLQRKNVQRLNIQKSAYLLMPAQTLSSGSPSEVPEGLGCFEAFEVLNGPKMRKSVSLKSTEGTKPRIVTKLAYICFPAEQWHHHEHFPVTNREACLLVYELESQELDLNVTTIDQFGLNKLSVNSARWLCVPGEIVGDSSGEKSK